MKKIISILLSVLLCFLFVACGKSEPRELSCEELIAAYEEAGYYVAHGEHQEETDSPRRCYIKASISQEPDSDYIYFTTCFTEEQAEEVREIDKYNLIIWFYAAISGESRWLKTGTYGKIAYSYYDPALIEPFQELIQ